MRANPPRVPAYACLRRSGRSGRDVTPERVGPTECTARLLAHGRTLPVQTAPALAGQVVQPAYRGTQQIWQILDRARGQTPSAAPMAAIVHDSGADSCRKA